MSSLTQSLNFRAQKIELDNGCRLLLDKTERFHSASLAICLLGGLRDETRAEVGITHLLEHMLFKRTSNLSSKEIACRLDEFGGQANAFTDADSLCLYGTVPQESFQEFFLFLSQLLLETAFNEEDLSVERDVVCQEISEAEDDPATIVYHEFCRRYWQDNILALPTFGTLESVKKITRDDLYQRREKLLCGNRLIIAAVGNIDETLFQSTAEQVFGKVPKGSLAQVEQVDSGAGYFKIEHSVSQIYLALGHPWPSVKQGKDYYTGQLISTVLGECMSSRLFQTLREEKGLVYEVDSEVDDFITNAVLMITSIVDRTNIDQALDLLLAELKQLIELGITQEELKRARRMICSQLQTAADSISTRLWRALETEIYHQKYIPLSETLENYLSIQQSDITQVLEKYLLKQQYLLVLGGNVGDYELSADLSWEP